MVARVEIEEKSAAETGRRPEMERRRFAAGKILHVSDRRQKDPHSACECGPRSIDTVCDGAA
jgi:hypothetical protein